MRALWAPLKISWFKHLKHETSSAQVIINLKWKKLKKKTFAATLGEAVFSKKNTDSFPFICSLLLLQICWMFFAYWDGNSAHYYCFLHGKSTVMSDCCPTCDKGQFEALIVSGDSIQISVDKTISVSRRDRDISPSNPSCQVKSSKTKHSLVCDPLSGQ